MLVLLYPPGPSHADNEISKATAYADCYASVIAEVWAFALAEATAEAQCWGDNDAHATAHIIAEVGAYIDQTERCYIDISETGTADGDVGGSSAGTKVVRPYFAGPDPPVLTS